MSNNLVLAGLVLGVLAAFSHNTEAQTPSTNFSDSLTGPDSPHIDISLSNNGIQSYDYTSEGLQRIFQDCLVYWPWGPCWKPDRPINKTVSSDFVAEIDMSEVGQVNWDIAFFGYGHGNPVDVNAEPGGFIFRIHAGPGDAQQIDVTFYNGAGLIEFTRLQEAASLNGGVATWDPAGETFRIERSGDDLIMSMVGGNSRTFSISAIEALSGVIFDATNSHLFFGNSSEGTIFSNFSVTSGAPDSDGDGVSDDDDNCPAVSNPLQEDADSDGAGDVCDDDDDNDGVLDVDDVCQGHDDNIDVDGDDIPNGCDSDNNNGPLGDLDGDGVNNQDDACDATPDGDVINDDGCSVTDLCDCDGAKNHGNYGSCITRTATDFRRDGLISNKDKSALTKAAAKSSCGK